MIEGDLPRWRQRLEEFGRMIDLFAQTDAVRQTRTLNEAEEAGLVQFFELSVELGWKTMAAFLRHQGVTLSAVAPLPIVREAARAGLIGDPDGWSAAVERRNLMSHTYDPDVFRLLIDDAGSRFLPLFMALRSKLQASMEP